MECPVAEACPGIDPHIVQTLTATGAVPTTVCSQGYTGPRCGDCQSSYYQLNGRCFYCGSSVDQTRDISLTISAALIATCLLASAVALLHAKPLAYTIQGFVVLQGVAMIGVEAAKRMPWASQMSAVAVWINLVNYDIEILRPGCGGVPTFTYVTKFGATLLFMALSACLFIVACMVRLGWRVRARRAAIAANVAQDDLDDMLVDEDEEVEEIAAGRDGKPRAARLTSVARTASMATRRTASMPVIVLTRKQRLKLFLRTPEWNDAMQRLQHSWLILGPSTR